jgi:LuxR family transcriptional regulator, maltose regulon positive regulatory protein
VPAFRRRQPVPLLDSELLVLRYLPTNLTVPEIASELYLWFGRCSTRSRSSRRKRALRS